jgi:hypothetical protein
MQNRGIGLCVWLLWWSFSPLLAQPKADGLCLAKACGWDLVQCGVEGDCRDWLQCVLACGEDKVRCPSICGFTFQSKRINKTNQCIFASTCVELGFAELGSYEHGDRPQKSLAGLEGNYWFAGSHGGSQILDVDGQRFHFRTRDQEPEVIDVHFAVPLMRKGQMSVRSAQGTFRMLADGSVEVAYDNFVGYHERWYILERTPHTLLAHVCIAGEEMCYNYGTLLLSQTSLQDLSEEERTALDLSLQLHLGIGWGDLKQNAVPHP